MSGSPTVRRSWRWVPSPQSKRSLSPPRRISTAFTAGVNALVKDIVTPLIAAVGGKPNFGNLDFTINGSRFAYGDFLNALVTFLMVAAVVFFLVIKPVNALMDLL